MKKFALKGLIILFVTVLLCMFFANTVQTITTAKVRIVRGQSGRFEDKMSLNAKIHFPEITEFVIEAAQKSAITVDKVFVKPGHWVDAGETIFTAKLPTFEADMKKLREEYEQKTRELIDLDIPNRKLSKQSAQNDLYDAMLDAQDALSAAIFVARAQALLDDVLLPSDIGAWETFKNAQTKLSDESRTAVLKTIAAKHIFDDARTEFFNSYENKKIKINSETFKYINDRNILIKAIDELSEQMTTLDNRLQTLTRINATQSGYIVVVNVAPGEPYEGLTAAYSMNKEGTLPVLRADITQNKRTIENGTRVEVPVNEWSNERTQALETTIAPDGTRYLLIALPETMAEDRSSAVRTILSEDGVNVNITYRAKQSTTLLPAGCVRSEGDSAYIFLIERSYGGVFAGTGMKVKKTPVTVVEKSDKVVSIAESFDYQEIADREDRPLEDGKAVMNYID